jgi:hypothetical protein
MVPSTSPDTIDDTTFLAELEHFDGSSTDAASASHGPSGRIEMLDTMFPLAVPHGSAAKPGSGPDAIGRNPFGQSVSRHEICYYAKRNADL